VDTITTALERELFAKIVDGSKAIRARAPDSPMPGEGRSPNSPADGE
jgi:hypothetical protein